MPSTGAIGIPLLKGGATYQVITGYPFGVVLSEDGTPLLDEDGFWIWDFIPADALLDEDGHPILNENQTDYIRAE